MYILLFIILLFRSTPNFSSPRLIISTIRTTHQFPISPISRKPPFQIILLSSSIIQFTRNNNHHSIRDPQRLIKLFSHSYHLIMHFPRFFWSRNTKLFYFLKLMNTENSPIIFSMSSCLFSETRRISSISNWE